jgi:dTDP-4-amino-4,6-dideoxygalactose transaminase
MEVKFYDLAFQNQMIKNEILRQWETIIDGNSFVLGDCVEKFEQLFAEYNGVDFCAGVANGTDALEILLRASELPENTQVLLPANTFAATAFAVSRAGYKIALVDINYDTMLIDTDSLDEEKLKKIRAIIPVHLYGQMVDIKELIKKIGRDVLIIEDAAQSQGAVSNDLKPGQASFGAATSFYPGKNLGAFGDAGAIVTNSQETIDKVRALRNYGSVKRYEHPTFGFNSRLDSLQAVVLLQKLIHLDNWNEQRNALAENYLEFLDNIDNITLPMKNSGSHHVWHLFVVRVPERENFMKYLLSKDIQTSIHYPKPIHLHGAFKELGYMNGEFPNAEKSASECVSLPLYPGMSSDQQEYVIEVIKEYFL